MNELIKVEKTVIGGKRILSVSARELYIGLGLNHAHWARWSKENIEKNEFFLEGIDFIQFTIMASPDNPRPPKDYVVSIEFAKHIAMQARTKKSHEYRGYMIHCETKAMAQLPDFTNPAIAARAWADEVEAKQAALKQIEADKPKVKFADVVTESSNTRCIRVWVKSMKHENNLVVGERAVFKWLLDNRYIFKEGNGYLPYAKYESNGLNYFTVVIDDINGKPRRMLKITGNGVVALTGKVVEYFCGNEFGMVPA
jgi:anti-repressor protein